VAVGEASPHRIALEQALSLTVGEIMIANPKAFPSNITVGEVRQAFEQNSHRVVLLGHPIDRRRQAARAESRAPARGARRGRTHAARPALLQPKFSELLHPLAPLAPARGAMGKNVARAPAVASRRLVAVLDPG
jgi:hypothetical protein